ncbi:HPP family protein [Pararhodobacter zhoushanensis]|uniref:HPP family protein n=1 Tax=Pararhodobacter zhoushanensis TaxID=2479545 RepID=A0ABT3H5R0_9RHOB|nr:HPP family protein [Pararhodobacter zhoushanensis]MCW1935055.1 HPP family protein [Pararhodobacter zhoushanensis]
MRGVRERQATQRLHRRVLDRLRPLGPAIGPARRRDIASGAAGSGLALMLGAAMLAGFALPAASGAFLIAPMGATAVLLFALPNSPLAQPWSAIVGNTVSALIALGVHQVTQVPALAIGAAAALALAAMLLTRSLHPPGGAVALTAALNPAMLDELGLGFALIPVLGGTTALVCAAWLWHRLSGRVYPFRQPHDKGAQADTDAPAALRLGLEPDALAQILVQYRQSANLGVEDLARLIAAAEQHAAGQALGTARCAQIMSRSLVTVPPTATATALADLFTRHGFSTVPVVDETQALLGVVFQLDLIRRFVTRADRADQLMTTGLATVAPQTPVADLIPLLAQGGAEAVPVMDGPRLVGIITRTDLLSAQARAIARHAP